MNRQLKPASLFAAALMSDDLTTPHIDLIHWCRKCILDPAAMEEVAKYMPEDELRQQIGCAVTYWITDTVQALGKGFDGIDTSITLMLDLATFLPNGLADLGLSLAEIARLRKEAHLAFGRKSVRELKRLGSGGWALFSARHVETALACDISREELELPDRLYDDQGMPTISPTLCSILRANSAALSARLAA